MDASVEAAWWLDDDRVAAATDPEEEALDGSGDGLQDTDTFVARAQEVARAIPQSRYLELPDVGHLTPVTHPRRVVGPVLRFFAEIDGLAGPSMP